MADMWFCLIEPNKATLSGLLLEDESSGQDKIAGQVPYSGSGEADTVVTSSFNPHIVQIFSSLMYCGLSPSESFKFKNWPKWSLLPPFPESEWFQMTNIRKQYLVSFFQIFGNEGLPSHFVVF